MLLDGQSVVRVLKPIELKAGSQLYRCFGVRHGGQDVGDLFRVAFQSFAAFQDSADLVLSGICLER